MGIVNKNNRAFFFGILSVFVITALITAQNLLMDTAGNNGVSFYNNYLIFKQSFFHLVNKQDLYAAYPTEYWDLYKYSPTFSLFMAPFAVLPDGLGLFFWNLLNSLVLFFALWQLPFSKNKTRLLIVAFILIEMITSLQNSQSNALIAGLIIMAFNALEKKQVVFASLFIVLTVFIKIFGVVAFALFILYPGKLRAAIYVLAWTIVLILIPVVVCPPAQLIFLYKSWLTELQNDHSISVGLSVMAMLNSWFNTGFSKTLIVSTGTILFCIPFLNYKFFGNLKFRILFLSSVLMWLVIFNHKAESPTFVIAIAGVAIWFFSQKKRIENYVLLIMAFVLTSLSPTDIFPASLRTNYFEHYIIKVLPCVLIWLKVIYELTFFKTEDSSAVLFTYETRTLTPG